MFAPQIGAVTWATPMPGARGILIQHGYPHLASPLKSTMFRTAANVDTQDFADFGK
jgi:hypothetical protein